LALNGLVRSTVCSVIAGLDPAIHSFCKEMDHRITALRAGPVMTPPG
jgi:hypothetical protein